MPTHRKPTIHLMALTAVICMMGMHFLVPQTGWCKKNAAKKAKESVGQSIDIRQDTQKKRDKWEEKKEKLVAEYESLKSIHGELLERNRQLTAEASRLEAVTRTLLEQKKESERIAKEMTPFLGGVYQQLELLVEHDTPFLAQERKDRLQRLRTLLDDVEISIAEKYRKVFEALFIETEYGSTIEVYQDKVLMGEDEVLGNIFRLGRVSMFFLSLDEQSAAQYSVGDEQWVALPDTDLAAIREAVEIGSRRRTAKLLALPIGRLSKGGE